MLGSTTHKQLPCQMQVMASSQSFDPRERKKALMIFLCLEIVANGRNCNIYPLCAGGGDGGLYENYKSFTKSIKKHAQETQCLPLLLLRWRKSYAM
jgi:hypothetical protein